MLQRFDPRNEHILIHVDGKLLPRDQAKVSVFDSSVQGGDAVWEGLRVYNRRVFCLSQHLQRLRESAHALAFAGVPDEAAIRRALFDTLHANSMYHDTHVRLTLTRGVKITSGMDPRLNTKGCTLIVLAEWKPPVYDLENGISVITASTRRNGPQYLDSKIHHNNLLNNILAKIEANVAGADAAMMLDDRGFLAELNDTNVFMVKAGTLYTPFAHHCLPGITRGLTLQLAMELDMPVVEKDLSLTEWYNADEAFCTGTMGELTPIVQADGRRIGAPLQQWIIWPKLLKALHEKTGPLGEPVA